MSEPRHSTRILVLALITTAGLSVLVPVSANSTQNSAQPKPAAGEQIAVFAGGCFWGVEAVFEHIKGVSEAESGYAGGSAGGANYEDVSSGNTGHAEAVRVRYDPAQVSYRQLLHVFFSVAHNPTELNRQGPDVGTQYRSAVFYGDAEQQKITQDYIRQLTASKAFRAPIVTQLNPLQAFYPAEKYHQNYLVQHPDQPYIVENDLPKLDQLRKQFPALYQASANGIK